LFPPTASFLRLAPRALHKIVEAGDIGVLATYLLWMMCSIVCRKLAAVNFNALRYPNGNEQTATTTAGVLQRHLMPLHTCLTQLKYVVCTPMACNTRLSPLKFVKVHAIQQIGILHNGG
jgi:hypothetical protein